MINLRKKKNREILKKTNRNPSEQWVRLAYPYCTRAQVYIYTYTACVPYTSLIYATTRGHVETPLFFFLLFYVCVSR